MKKTKIEFYDIIEEHVDNCEDVVLTCSSNGIYAIVDNSVGNCSTIIEYNQYKDEIISFVLPNEMFKYLERNNDIGKVFSS